MKDISIYLRSTGNISWGNTLKQVILPIYIELKKKDLLNVDLNICLYSVVNYLLIWEKTFKYIFPKAVFKWFSISNKPVKPDINIIYYWVPISFVEKPELYNKNIKKEDIEDFNQYLEKTIPLPKNNKHYHIIFIKRITGVSIDYYKSIKPNDISLRGITFSPKYIKKTDAVYEQICARDKSKSVLYVDLVDLDFPERFHYFRNADILVGQQGSAMVQSLFMKPEKNVIEYTNLKNYQENFTRQICIVKNIHYHYCLYSGNINKSIEIDIPQLLQEIRLIYKRKIKTMEVCMNPLSDTPVT
jgi:hypothetical protein